MTFKFKSILRQICQADSSIIFSRGFTLFFLNGFRTMVCSHNSVVSSFRGKGIGSVWYTFWCLPLHLWLCLNSSIVGVWFSQLKTFSSRESCSDWLKQKNDMNPHNANIFQKYSILIFQYKIENTMFGLGMIFSVVDYLFLFFMLGVRWKQWHFYKHSFCPHAQKLQLFFLRWKKKFCAPVNKNSMILFFVHTCTIL